MHENLDRCGWSPSNGALQNELHSLGGSQCERRPSWSVARSSSLVWYMVIECVSLETPWIEMLTVLKSLSNLVQQFECVTTKNALGWRRQVGVKSFYWNHSLHWPKFVHWLPFNRSNWNAYKSPQTANDHLVSLESKLWACYLRANNNHDLRFTRQFLVPPHMILACVLLSCRFLTRSLTNISNLRFNPVDVLAYSGVRSFTCGILIENKRKLVQLRRVFSLISEK